MSLENLLKGGYFTAQREPELRYYAESLPDDATMPKQKLLDKCDKIEEEQKKIAEINSRAELMKQRAYSFISSDVYDQANTINNAINTNQESSNENEELAPV